MPQPLKTLGKLIPVCIRQHLSSINVSLCSNQNSSPAWFVGYAEDDESVDAIMKKFEELDRLKTELNVTTPLDHQPHNPAAPLNPDHNSDQITGGHKTLDTSGNGISNSSTSHSVQMQIEEPIFTQDQLEELFKRTSSFTIKSALMRDPSYYTSPHSLYDADGDNFYLDDLEAAMLLDDAVNADDDEEE